MKFIINKDMGSKRFEVIGSLTSYIHSQEEDLIITVENKAEDRSSAQNRLAHKWYKEISSSTGHELWYETGRCKERYFLPLLKMSENETSRQAYWVAMTIKQRLIKAGKSDAFYEVLYSGLAPSTRFLSVKEFSTALEHMQQGEAIHNLTSPLHYGLDFRR